MKRCSKCGETKDLNSFYKDKNRGDGLYTYCKECSSMDRKAYYESNKGRLQAAARDWHRTNASRVAVVVETKHCPKCDTTKSASEFDKDRSQLTGLRNWCKECRKEKWDENRAQNLITKRARYKKYRDKNLAYARKYTSENKEIINQKQREYKRKPEVRQAIRIYWKNRRDTDPMLRLNNATRAAIYHSLQGNKKGMHWEDVVGFSLEELKRHLEKQFKPGMSWENYGDGGWEIDHKTPLAAHNFSSPDQLDFKRAWNLKNLRPMWAPDNRSKSDKLEKPFQPALAIAV